MRNILSISRKTAGLGTLALACVVTSFSVGMHTSGSVQPFSLIEAGSTVLHGDMDGNGVLDSQDVAYVLEVSQGYRAADPELLRLDPNQDGELTVDDALWILAQLR